MIDKARDFIFNQVDNPALRNSVLEKSLKNKVQATKNTIGKFKKIGDLYHYMQRFEKKPNPGENEIYDRFKSLELDTYEDVFQKFKDEFSFECDDVTTLNDFIIGERYSSWDIAIFAKMYNCQSGIYLIGKKSPYKAIFIKATLNGGKYSNEWIIPNDEFKYYMHSRKDKFSIEYKVNQAIIDSKGIPIYLFIKNNKKEAAYTLSGIFSYLEYKCEPDDSKWFRLKKDDSFNNSVISENAYNEELSKKISAASRRSKEEREENLKNSSKKPEMIQVMTNAYKRNPDVIISVLERANGVCEACHKPAPFNRLSNGTPYLEVHHIILLSQGGDDTVDNAKGICPNCHRKVHFGVE